MDFIPIQQRSICRSFIHVASLKEYYGEVLTTRTWRSRLSDLIEGCDGRESNRRTQVIWKEAL